MVFSIDGRQMLKAVVEGSTDYNYARGETVVRAPVTAGDHFLRASFPELANLDDPRTHMNRDGRRKIFIDYLDIVAPTSLRPRRLKATAVFSSAATPLAVTMRSARAAYWRIWHTGRTAGHPANGSWSRC
jgi:hypothetical protein